MAKELHHYSYEQAKEHIEEAVRIVQELELDGDLRIPAFSKAVEMLSGKQIIADQRELSPVLAAMAPSLSP